MFLIDPHLQGLLALPTDVLSVTSPPRKPMKGRMRDPLRMPRVYEVLYLVLKLHMPPHRVPLERRQWPTDALFHVVMPVDDLGRLQQSLRTPWKLRVMIDLIDWFFIRLDMLDINWACFVSGGPV